MALGEGPLIGEVGGTCSLNQPTHIIPVPVHGTEFPPILFADACPTDAPMWQGQGIQPAQLAMEDIVDPISLA